MTFSACQGGLLPEVTGVISGQVADFISDFSKEIISGYSPVFNAKVTLVDAEGIIHTTYTNSEGYYQFDNLSVKANTFIDIVKETKGGKKVYKNIILPEISPEDNYNVGLTSAFSTAQALVLEALIKMVDDPDNIDLDEISQNNSFNKLIDLVRQAQLEEEDITSNYSIEFQINKITTSIINPPSPSSSPAQPPTPPLSSAKDILTYRFEAAHNEALYHDVVSIIDNETYTMELTVPYGTELSGLIATFELSPSATALVEELLQESGITPNDFTDKVIYTILAENNTGQDWEVIVNQEIGPLDYFTITGYPYECIAGEDFGNHNITVTAYDGNNKVKDDYTREIYFTSSDTMAVLPYTSVSKYTFTEEDKGIHTFSGTEFMFKTADSQTIMLTDGNISMNSDPITVSAAELERFLFNAINEQIAGIPFSLTITAKDKYWNTVTDYTETNTLSDSTGTINPDYTGNFINGVWSDEVTINNKQKNIQITTSGSGKTGYSNLFEVILNT